MGHPFAEHRQSKVEKSRVAHISKGYATGGAVHSDEAEDKALVKKIVKPKALKMEGGKVKHRADRPMRASGGRVKKGHKGTNVNVIVGAQHPGMGPMAAPGPMPGAPMLPPGAMPPGGPMAGPPGLPPGLPPGGPMPPGPRAAGGRTYAKGGRVGSKVYEEGVRNGTQVTHDKGKNDLKDMNRGRVVTYKTGGAIKRASGGRTEAPAGKAGMGPDMDAGAGGGEGRLEKMRDAKKRK